MYCSDWEVFGNKKERGINERIEFFCIIVELWMVGVDIILIVKNK